MFVRCLLNEKRSPENLYSLNPRWIEAVFLNFGLLKYLICQILGVPVCFIQDEF